jgi:photosystem II PsbU protein
MKRLFRWLSVLSLMLGCLGWFGSQSAMAAPGFHFHGLLRQPMMMAATIEEEGLRNKVSDKLATDFGKKLDLNNTNVRAFRELKGMYPNLAGILVKNAPYQAVNDIFDIPGLSEAQKDTLKANLDNFVVTDVEEALVEGGDRINNGIYR